MDYYEHVVFDYLRADRALFVNTECCIQVEGGHNPEKFTHWYCDALVTDFRDQAVFLCEISYSRTLAALLERLTNWNQNWDGIRNGLARDSFLPGDWLLRLRPWLFVPEDLVSATLVPALKKMGKESPAFVPRITPLEMVQPWKYCSWDRQGEISCCTLHKCAKNKVPEEYWI